MGVVRIGGGQGFYGDGVQPVGDVLEAGVDYLVCEALAELTLAILQKDRQRDESLGFTRDLPLYVRSAIPYLVDGRTKLITNAGGINPVAAGRAVVDTLKAAGVAGLTVATVVGDDVRPLADELSLPDDTLFANVYLGARPIVEALAGGADVIVTGRVADASLFVAPLVHEHGWAWDDWDRLSAGVAVGHLLECSGSVAGGNYSGTWWENPDPLRIGFPIGEVRRRRHARSSPSRRRPAAWSRSTRSASSSSTRSTIPRAYLNPDATADFTSLTLDRPRPRPGPGERDAWPCRAGHVQGARVPPGRMGRRGDLRLLVARRRGQGPSRRGVGAAAGRAGGCRRATSGARSTSASTRSTARRARRTAPPLAAAGFEPPEVIGRLAWRAADPETAGRVAQGAGVLGLSGPPQIAGFGRARGGKPTQLLSLEAIAVARDLVDPRVRVELTTI